MKSPSLKAFSLTVPALRVISVTDSLAGLCHVYSKRISPGARMALRARFLVFFAHLPVGARESIPFLRRRNYEHSRIFPVSVRGGERLVFRILRFFGAQRVAPRLRKTNASYIVW